jgi:hypothetical protein
MPVRMQISHVSKERYSSRLIKLTAVKVAGRKTVVITDITLMAALSRVAISVIRFWSSEMVFSAALSFVLSALSFCAIKL